MAKSQAYRPDPAILALGDEFYDPVEAADFPQATERFFNHRRAKGVGLDDLDTDARTAHFARFEPLADNLPEPLALRYHGHQFRHYNPDLGDGRGFLFAQMRGRDGRLLDLGTKGSGQTPWSRRGDGRLTLKGGVREILATEMLEALGVNTSKSFALYETGENLWRGDEPSPTRSSVLTRLSHGHIRIGTFQRLAFFKDESALERLTDYCISQLYDLAIEGAQPDRAQQLFALVAERTADLAASYMAAGFIHGVLNSDNIAITGESFDYGPWRFTPNWDPEFTAAYFDETGLYAFGRQPEAIQWDLAQLGGALSLIAPVEGLEQSLNRWPGLFHERMTERMFARLGVTPIGDDSDREVVRALIAALETRDVTIDRLFFDWRGGIDPGGDTYAADHFRSLAEVLKGRAGRRPDDAYWSGGAPVSMHKEEVERIWDAIAEKDDWQPFERKVADVRRMGAAMQDDA